MLLFKWLQNSTFHFYIFLKKFSIVKPARAATFTSEGPVLLGFLERAPTVG